MFETILNIKNNYFNFNFIKKVKINIIFFFLYTFISIVLLINLFLADNDNLVQFELEYDNLRNKNNIFFNKTKSISIIRQFFGIFFDDDKKDLKEEYKILLKNYQKVERSTVNNNENLQKLKNSNFKEYINEKYKNKKNSTLINFLNICKKIRYLNKERESYNKYFFALYKCVKDFFEIFIDNIEVFNKVFNEVNKCKTKNYIIELYDYLVSNSLIKQTQKNFKYINNENNTLLKSILYSITNSLIQFLNNYDNKIIIDSNYFIIVFFILNIISCQEYITDYINNINFINKNNNIIIDTFLYLLILSSLQELYDNNLTKKDTNFKNKSLNFILLLEHYMNNNNNNFNENILKYFNNLNVFHNMNIKNINININTDNFYNMINIDNHNNNKNINKYFINLYNIYKNNLFYLFFDNIKSNNSLNSTFKEYNISQIEKIFNNVSISFENMIIKLKKDTLSSKQIFFDYKIVNKILILQLSSFCISIGFLINMIFNLKLSKMIVFNNIILLIYIIYLTFWYSIYIYKAYEYFYNSYMFYIKYNYDFLKIKLYKGNEFIKKIKFILYNRKDLKKIKIYKKNIFSIKFIN